MIYLVRHGQTEFNQEKRFQGRLDSPLTANGMAQAHAVGHRLRALVAPGIGWVIETSPQGHALHTAQIVRAVMGIAADPVIDDRLREVSLGSWDGLCRDEIELKWPGAMLASSRQSWAERCPDGESVQQAIDRCTAWLASQREGRRCIVVSHGITGSIIRGVYAGLSVAEMLRLPVPQDSFFELSHGRINQEEGLHSVPSDNPVS
jgi:broad specificity phosphatase PhoE